MLRACCEWRSSFLPSIHQSPLPNYTGSVGIDMDGRPVVMWYGSKYGDPKQRTLVDSLRAVVRCIEDAIARSPPGGDGMITAIVYIDLGSVFDKNLVQSTCKILSDNYPERLHKVLIYPGTALTQTLWAICKWFLDAKTRQKFVIVPDGSHQLSPDKNLFLSYISSQQLCREFGGAAEYGAYLELAKSAADPDESSGGDAMGLAAKAEDRIEEKKERTDEMAEDTREGAKEES